MHGLDLIYHQHRELMRLTEAVMAVADESEISVDRVAAARHALGQVIIKHVTDKQALITAALRASADPAHHALAWRFTEDLMKLRQSTSEHYGVWTMKRVQEDPREFRMAVRSQHRLLKARIDWEETEVFPIVERLLAAAAPKRAAGGIR